MSSPAPHHTHRDRPPVELADIVRAHVSELGGLSAEQSSALTAIARCRTDALGGHLYVCDSCGHPHITYNSCSNRHCPKCQGLAELEWVERRSVDLLPVPYFHVVFTVPDALHPLFLFNRRLAYNLLFAAAAKTLQEVALNPEHLGARIGFTATLHTWTQQLLYHPHIHCVVAAGGLSFDAERWVHGNAKFFLPVRVLAVVFRGKLLSALEAAANDGTLTLAAATIPRVLKKAANRKWVVYAKPPFAGPKHVLAYLGHYTHRIAISNSRILAFESGQVTFGYKDRTADNAPLQRTLPAGAFLRRFLLHVLPAGFQRLRHYGFLANSVRTSALAQCRDLLGVAQPPPVDTPSAETRVQRLLRLTGRDLTRCPKCNTGHLVQTGILPPAPEHWSLLGRATSP